MRTDRKLKKVLNVVISVVIALGVISTVAFNFSKIKGFFETKPTQSVIKEQEEESKSTLSQYGEEATQKNKMSITGTVCGFNLNPGVDILNNDIYQDEFKESLDKSFKEMKSAGFNSVFVNTSFSTGKVIFSTQHADQYKFKSSEQTPYQVIYRTAKDNGLSVYSILNISTKKGTSESYNLTSEEGYNNALALAEDMSKQPCDGILIDGYTLPDGQGDYNRYLQVGGGMGIQEWSSQTLDRLVSEIQGLIKKQNKNMYFGIFANDVWSNQKQNKNGSQTNASFADYTNGNADTKAWIEKGLIDFVLVKDYNSISSEKVNFVEVAKWWSNLTYSTQTNLIICHSAEKSMSGKDGFTSVNELANQMSKVCKLPAYKGSSFDSVKAICDNKQGGTKPLLDYIKENMDSTYKMNELEITSPKKTNFSTQDKTVTVMGISDASFPLTVNNTTIKRNDDGSFVTTLTLEDGMNTFVFKHKDKEITYKITKIYK